MQLTKPFSDVAGLCSALPPPPTDSPHTPPTERRLDRDDALEPTPSTQVALFIVPWPRSVPSSHFLALFRLPLPHSPVPAPRPFPRSLLRLLAIVECVLAHDRGCVWVCSMLEVCFPLRRCRGALGLPMLPRPMFTTHTCNARPCSHAAALPRHPLPNPSLYGASQVPGGFAGC